MIVLIDESRVTDNIKELIYSISTYYKYYFSKKEVKIYPMFSRRLKQLEQSNDSIKDIYINILRSVLLKNPFNLPYSLEVAKFVDHCDDFE
jgi:hypothetical protein